MALVERLMGLESPKIPVHGFFAGANEIIEGRLTAAQVKTYFAMDASASAEFDTIAATAPTGTTALATAQKALWLGGIHSIFILAEDLAPGYNTPAGVRLKLGI